MTGYPVQAGKVQPPSLREDTLPRPRLLDWLQAKIHNRLVLVIAEAGYGKTTLLADFSRRTRVRTLWYRLDESDRGWAPFIAHLIAAGREHDPNFAPATFELLSGPDPGGPSRELVVGSLLRELAATTEGGAALILDDFHLVDDSDEVGELVRDLMRRGPDRLTFVISSRRRPPIPIARLRALGEVAELIGNDLRFDVDETASLFRDAYRNPLDADTVEELTRRTEGWAASLQLVQAAIRGRSTRDARAFIRSLSGAEGDLYDYLAEEVVGHLSPEMQRFLMRASLLETVEPELASVVAETSPSESRALIGSAERFGLLTRRGSTRGAFRFHPLVQQFLRARIEREVSSSEIQEMHRSAAIASEQHDWRRAAFHFAEAGDTEATKSLLERSLEHILAKGEYEAAESAFARIPSVREQTPSFLVIQARSEYRRGHTDAAMRFAEAAVERDPDNEFAALNLLSLSYSMRDLGRAAEMTSTLAEEALTPVVRDLARLHQELLSISLGGSLSLAVASFRRTANEHRRSGHRHYEGIALVDAAVVLRAMGDALGALSAAAEALEALESSSAGPERGSARMVRAWALAHLGKVDEARAEARQAIEDGGDALEVEAKLEAADLEIWYGEEEAARKLLGSLPAADSLDPDQAEQLAVSQVSYLLRTNDVTSAADLVKALRYGQHSSAAAMEARRYALRAHAAVRAGMNQADELIAVALEAARRQGADFWLLYTSTLRAFSQDAKRFNASVRRLCDEESPYLSLFAEVVMARYDEWAPGVGSAIEREVERRPDRWRELLRHEVRDNRRNPPRRVWAARNLETVGQKEDIPLLRGFVRAVRAGAADTGIGRRLARRLADPVVVSDQGRVAIVIGNRHIFGTEVRRKALALLCFLLTRSGFSATKDEVLDALWPDMDPALALNSLNQTIYFLRRVIEPTFAEDTSPGYVRYASDLVWLDTDLVDSQSARCRRMLAALDRPPSPEQVEALALEYQGKFALDFAYEDWSISYRDSLHAAYLGVIEESVRRDVVSGHFERGAAIARRALEIDSEAHQIEGLLIKIYKLSGAHAAAAEQYSHYATSMREELGIEPATLGEL